jgi:threonine dehydrogenase-like Zn-dependent dehydrogenase
MKTNTIKTCKAIQIMAPGKSCWVDMNVPQPKAHDVLVRLTGVTTCPHWDMHMMDGQPMLKGHVLDYPLPPGQPGHEAIGQVEAIGEDVTSLTVGQRVACWRDAGHHRPGFYAQYGLAHEADLLPIPDDAKPQAYAPLELAMCVRVSFEQLERLMPLTGLRIGVAGLGPAGLIAIQMAQAAGAAEVLAIDPIASRRELAMRHGADTVYAPDDQRWLELDRRGKNALDMAIDCTGLKISIEPLLDRTRHAVAIFGVLREAVQFHANHWAGLSLLGYGSHHVQAARDALELIQTGKLDLTPLVTHTLPLSCYAQGVELLRSHQAIKVCFLPEEGQA